MADRDDFYRDILDGLSVYFDSIFIRDILATAAETTDPDLGYALNANQIRSKKWLVDALFEANGATTRRVCVLGGWYGVLGALLLQDRRFDLESVVSIDRNPACEALARGLNRSHVAAGRFATETADIATLDYDRLVGGGGDGAVLVCTSCEHLDRFEAWYDRLPAGVLLALQSNDYYACEEHVNCVPDLAAFTEQTPMAEVLFAGVLPHRKYARFMRIGRK